MDSRTSRLEAEIERLRAEVEHAWDDGHIAGREKSPTMQENRELRDRAEQAEARLAKVVEALKVAREYVKATEGQLVTRPNIVTKDRELCDAALAAAQPEKQK